jgi:hypothetical protein
VENNKLTVLLVFAPVFGVAPDVAYAHAPPIPGIADQPGSGAMLADLLLRAYRKR